MMQPDSSSLSSARRVYVSCGCCWPQVGHVEEKSKGLAMGADPFPKPRSEALIRTSRRIHGTLSPYAFFWRLAYRMPLEALAQRLRCSQCGKKAAGVVAVAKPRPRKSSH